MITISVSMQPVCECGEVMVATGKFAQWKGLLLNQHRCPNRRLWNAWRHRDRQTLVTMPRGASREPRDGNTEATALTTSENDNG